MKNRLLGSVTQPALLPPGLSPGMVGTPLLGQRRTPQRHTPQRNGSTPQWHTPQRNGSTPQKSSLKSMIMMVMLVRMSMTGSPCTMKGLMTLMLCPHQELELMTQHPHQELGLMTHRRLQKLGLMMERPHLELGLMKERPRQELGLMTQHPHLEHLNQLPLSVLGAAASRLEVHSTWITLRIDPVEGGTLRIEMVTVEGDRTRMEDQKLSQATGPALSVCSITLLAEQSVTNARQRKEVPQRHCLLKTGSAQSALLPTMNGGSNASNARSPNQRMPRNVQLWLTGPVRRARAATTHAGRTVPGVMEPGRDETRSWKRTQTGSVVAVVS